MPETEWFDINKYGNLRTKSKRSIIGMQLSIEHGMNANEMMRKLLANVDNKQIAELPFQRTDGIKMREWLIKAVANAIKAKYQPQKTVQNVLSSEQLDAEPIW